MENILAEVTSVPRQERVSDSRSDPFVNKLNRKHQQTHRPQRVELKKNASGAGSSGAGSDCLTAP